MKNKKDWFRVDVDGLAQLQAGKPKWHVVRELVQNAFDESVTRVSLTVSGANGSATVAVEDDSPEGFRDLTDAFTLFGTTYKRSDPTKRGRYNFGEKQAIAQADRAVILTTKGGVSFERNGARRTLRTKREAGSRVELQFRCNVVGRAQMIEQAKRFVPPAGVEYLVNSESVSAPVLKMKFTANALKTVVLEDGMMNDTYRSTEVRLYERNGKAWLYELGIPVCEIDCKWSLDVQQKVPLAMDRETVPESFLSDLYAQVLNRTVAELEPAESSETWVRLAAQDIHNELKADALKTLMRKRYGEKVCVATPGAQRENDEAVANGYKVIHGSELSDSEWRKLRETAPLPSSAQLFGLTPGNAERVEPTAAMQRVAALAKKIAKRVDGYDLAVEFIRLPGSAGVAWFGNRTLKFVVDKLPSDFFDEPTAPKVIDLIIHELGHEHGSHTERTYLDALTRISGRLVFIALAEPEFFNSTP